MRSGQEISAALRTFTARWRGYAGSERGEAQTFLNELFACYGTDRKTVAVFEDAHSSTGIMDCHWPGVVIVEMKAPQWADRIEAHRQQALDYWRHSSDVATDRPAPPWVVLCAFQRFEVWEPGRFPMAPRASFTLDELADSYDRLLFLAGADQAPLFGEHFRALTTEAAELMGGLHTSLAERQAAPPETVAMFVLQVVWCLFAEDLGMLDGYPVQTIVDGLLRDGNRSSYAELGALFEVLNDPEDYGRQGVLRGTRYVNGSLFERPARVHLMPEELEVLRQAATFDWRRVDPTIFGSLMEKTLGKDRRKELGAHYTHEADIMKIVRPTVVAPWQERIEATSSATEARALLDELCSFRVLDPACGCGNFLYLAYRELRRLEHDLKQRIRDLAARSGVAEPPGPWPYVPLANMQGLELEPSSMLLTRVTLWMGHRQVTDLYGEAEPVLPLVDLSGVQRADALFTPWPVTDCIIGNPPFLGSQHMRRALGDAYVDRVADAFGVGIKDLCVYWFRKAQDHLGPGQRAGLVGTNSVSQNRARGASLDYIVEHGSVITDAISTQKWPGEAKVHVSIVNWLKQPAQPPVSAVLDGLPVPSISPELRASGSSTADAARLTPNLRRCFQGPIPVGDGFILPAAEARELLARKDADYRQVVRPYLTGEDIAQDPQQHPRRWIVDFGVRSLEEAMRFPAALEIARARVKPRRDTNLRTARRERWWLFGEKAVGMRTAITGQDRYVTAISLGKRLLFCWSAAWTLPNQETYVFAFDDEASLGVLMGRAHSAWARQQGSTLESRTRYTSTSVFETLPWPLLTDDDRQRIGEAGRLVLDTRQHHCVEEQIGLTTLYNRVDDGAYTDVRDAHAALDRAVVTAYGWPVSVAQNDAELVRRLYDLNQRIVRGEVDYHPFPAADTGQLPLE